MEVSFEQWYHEVQCVKDHYPESVVQESIMQSLNGAAADMARYMGPTASMAHILQKLMVIFWHCGEHPYAIFLESDAGQPREGPSLHHKAERDPQPNRVAVPWEDNQLRGATAPQRLSLPQGL